MNQLAMPYSFTETRSRRTDSQTSKDAAKAAVSRKADQERRDIRCAVNDSTIGLTAREAATLTGIDYYTVQRRISETGLTKTAEVRDGCRVWVAK